MTTVSELTVILKYETSTYKEKFLLYDQYNLSYDDPVIIDCVKQSMDNCRDNNPENVKIKIHMEWQ